MPEEPRKGDAADDTAADSPLVVSKVATHRPCVACGYDLHGQPVRFDPSTGRRTARCPECGKEQDAYALDPALWELIEFPHWPLRMRLALAVLWPFTWWIYETMVRGGYHLTLDRFVHLFRRLSYHDVDEPHVLVLLQMAGMLLGVWLSCWLVRPIRRLLLPGLTTSPSRRLR